ncbi:MAG: alanine--glyoxylate aminotransferase family protein [Elusimicrobiota bacterium]|jgi:aspartate aminotransferase-like enzyme|nr:alanine--glyoxylate aminotransferase family protein [Elusimicrobiota bacterium]
MKKYYLLTPGPTPIPPEVALKEAMPILHHRTSEFGQIFKDTAEGLKYVFCTQQEVYILAGSGTAAMETAVVNFLSAGDEIIVASCGIFGDRWKNIAKAYGVKVIDVSVPYGEAVKPEEIEKALKENPNVKAVFTTFTETSTGVANDIKAIGKIVAGFKAILVVDAVSGLGGQEFLTDAWEVDVVVSGSQKGFMLAPGLAFITVSKKAWELAEKSTLPKFYFDLKKYKKSYLTDETPFTPPVTLIVSLNQAIKMIQSEGLENMWAQYALLAKATRAAMQGLGLELFAKVPCEVVTSVKVDESIGSKIVKLLRDNYGVSIAGGQGAMKGKIIRFAHMGYIGKADLLVGISCLEMALTQLGVNVKCGAGIGIAEEVLLKG